MVRHIVMWKLKPFAEGNDRAKNAAIIKERLEALTGVIPQIVEAEVQLADEAYAEKTDGYHAVLTVIFKSLEDLDAYRVDPRHQAVADFVKLVRESRAAADILF